ncbi:MAG: glycosyltransferase [Deltaproteobacteria bacterium]|nr:glycosyltransferase [Deltaproteobacteria bacterium]MBW2362078.1 glycosyltransferase [Deltaproteobacteria bacterium]
MSAPLVSVLMCTYNDMQWLPTSIDSVLAQSLADLEFVIVDDGSTDGTPELLAATARRDPRVQVERIKHGRPARALNHGLGLVRGELIARLDADDWAHPERLEAQLAHLRAHPEVGIIGSTIEKMDEDGRVEGPTGRPLDDATIRFKSLLWCPFTSSSVTMRREVLERARLRYDETLRGSEDYDFFARVLDHTRSAALDRPLARYRVRAGGFSRRNRDEFEAIAVDIAGGVIARALPGFATDAAEVASLRAAFHGMGRARPPAGRAGTAVAGRYLDLLDAFCAGPLDDRERVGLRAAEARRFVHTLDPSPDPARLRLLMRLTRMDRGFARAWWRAWRRRRSWRGARLRRPVHR